MKDTVAPYYDALETIRYTKNQFVFKWKCKYIYNSLYLSIFSRERCKVQTFAKKMNSQVSWMPKLQPNTFLIQRIFIVSFIFLYATVRLIMFLLRHWIKENICCVCCPMWAWNVLMKWNIHNIFSKKVYFKCFHCLIIIVFRLDIEITFPIECCLNGTEARPRCPASRLQCMLHWNMIWLDITLDAGHGH